MDTFFSTFISGTREIVKELLKQKLKNVKVTLLLDGLMVYETSSISEEIKKLGFMSNSFILAGQVNGTMESMLKKLDRKKIAKRVGRKPIRFMFFDKNLPTSIGKGKIKFLERGFVVSRSNPQVEVDIFTRSEGYTFAGVRLTRHTDYKKILRPGQLRPDLANILCCLSEPNAQDVFMDPFSGFGTIADQRKKIGKYKKIISGDLASITNKLDATNLFSVKDRFVSKIVTDPPWGLYEKMNVEPLYTGMLKEFDRVLVTSGILVVLTAQKELFEDKLKEIANFKLQSKYDILVSGKKAAIYKIIKC